MAIEDLVKLIETSDDAGRADLPSRASIDELAGEGRTDQLLLLVAAQELVRLYYTVTRWQESGCPGGPPLTCQQMEMLHKRANGGAVCDCLPVSGHITETYRSFCLWYARALGEAHTAGPDRRG